MSHNGDHPDSDKPITDSDLLIDSLLDECLGGKTPPDLTKQILAQLNAESRSEDQTLVSTRRTSHARQYKSARSNHFFSRLAVVAALIVVTSAVGLVIWNTNRSQLALDEVDNGNSNEVVTRSDDSVENNALKSGVAVEIESESSLPEVDTTDSIVSIIPTEIEPGAVEPEDKKYFGPSRYDITITPASSDEIVTFVNHVFRDQWAANQIKPSAPWSEARWLNNVFVRVIGRSPNQAEIERFVRSDSPTKRSVVVRSLVESEDYAAEFTAHWTTVLQNRLLNDDAASPAIAAAVAQGQPYNQLVETLVDVSKSDVVSICRNILGARLECAKCHANQGQSTEHYEQLVAWLRPENRSSFARAVASSDEANEAFVNSIWQHFFGHRLTPWTSDTEPALQPALDRMTEEFIATGFDTKQLIQWVALTDAFAVSDQITPSNKSDSVVADEPLFARNYFSARFAGSRQAILDKVAASSIDYMGVEGDPIDTISSRAPNLKTRDVVQTTDQPEFWSTIEFMNRDPDRAGIIVRNGSLLQEIASSKLNHREKAEHVFLAATGERPTEAELESAVKILKSQSSYELLGLRDVWWAIEKSNDK